MTSTTSSESSQNNNEYWFATQKCGVIDRSDMSRVRISGVDALELLDRLSTNALQELVSGSSLHSVMTTNKGRVVCLLLVALIGDQVILITGSGDGEKASELIDFYTFSEDVKVQDIGNETGQLSLVGPRCSFVLEQLGVGVLNPYECVSISVNGIPITAIRSEFLAQPSYDLIIPAQSLKDVNDMLLTIGGVEICSISKETLNLVRVERGIPESGFELTEEYNPLEVELKNYISFNKGCYVGQEVVARLNTYDKVKRRLVGVTWHKEMISEPGANLFYDGENIGTLTSTTKPHQPGRFIGLGVVKKAYAEAGTELHIISEEQDISVKAVVEALPFDDVSNRGNM